MSRIFFLVLLFSLALRKLNWDVEEPRAGPWKEDWRLDRGVRGLQAQTSVLQKIDQGDQRNGQNGRRKTSCGSQTNSRRKKFCGPWS